MVVCPRRAVGAGMLILAVVVAIGWSPATASAAETSPSASAPAAAPIEPPPGTLQAMIDATPGGGVLDVPPGIYRETIVIRSPLILRGPGAEIRGSDVWSTWTASGAVWRSADVVPTLESGGECREPRCRWPEQVFVDGAPRLQVASDPGAQEFALDADRRILLGDDPAGRLVEVTTRARWITVEAADVEIDGLTMRHAASPAQSGAIQTVAGADRLTIRGVDLNDAHGALVSFRDVADASLLDSELRRGGQLAVHAGGGGTLRLTIARSRLLDSNTEAFEPGWEAGGLKAALAIDLVVEDSEVTGNDGPGLWCDVDCSNTRFMRNRVGDNANAGLMFEISDGALIADNVVWENGWGFPAWGWGAGILVSSSTQVIVRDNVVAWNADGISVISQVRGRDQGDRVQDVQVLDNSVVVGDTGGFGIAWLQDWEGRMFADDGGNVGRGNAIWLPDDPATPCPFEWVDCQATVTAFADTRGGRESRTLTVAERDSVLVEAGLAAKPAPHVVVEEPVRLRPLMPVAVGIVGVVVVLLGAIVLVRRVKRPPRI